MFSNVWSENTALFERLMEIPFQFPNQRALYYGFNFVERKEIHREERIPFSNLRRYRVVCNTESKMKWFVNNHLGRCGGQTVIVGVLLDFIIIHLLGEERA